MNSDAVENVFCMQRPSYRGANTNPAASQYKYLELHHRECPVHKSELQFSSPLKLDM